MGYRGRLHHVVYAELFHLDGPEMDAVEGGGFDDVFREPRLLSSASGAAAGIPLRIESEPALLRCQYEPVVYKATEMTPQGDDQTTEFQLIVSRREMEKRGMVADDGSVKIRKHDRVSRILDNKGGVIVSFGDDAFVDRAEPDGVGFGRNARCNLYVITVKSSQKGYQP